jgi:hypothetical protein
LPARQCPRARVDFAAASRFPVTFGTVHGFGTIVNLRKTLVAAA